MMKEMKGVCFLFSETGTEGGWWAMQEDGFVTEDGHWRYEGLQCLKEGDDFTVYAHDGRVLFHGIIHQDTTTGAIPRQVLRTLGPKEHGLRFRHSLLPLADPRRSAAWLGTLFRHDWVVYAKRRFGGPEHVLRYLGAYTHRVAISNHRLVALDRDSVRFRWRDSAHGNKRKLMSLHADEFLRRFLLHLLPRGFVRIRNFGFLANRRRARLLPVCFELLRGSAAQLSSALHHSHSSSWRCPACGGTMRMIERVSAADLLLRSPPPLTRCAA